MQKATLYLPNRFPKACWRCGKPFVVRKGLAEAIVGPDDRLYCFKTGCEDAAFAEGFALDLAS